MEKLIVVWGTDQSPFINKMLDKLKVENVVQDYMYRTIDPQHVEYEITCFDKFGFFKVGYESARLIKYLTQ